MAAVDATSLADPSSGRDYGRWAIAGAVAVALHGVAFLYLSRAPAPAGFESQIPIELDLMPPPPGEAQSVDPGAVDVAGVEATQQVQPDKADDAPQDTETLEEIDPDRPPPPPVDEAVVTDDATPLDSITPDEAQAVTAPLDSVETPPDVQAAVTLPAQRAATLPPPDAVIAREEAPSPPKPAPPIAKKVEPKPEPPVAKTVEPKPEPKPKPVAKKAEPKPKPEPKRQEQPKPAVKVAERDREATQAQQAGGAGGVSTKAGAAAASRAAAAAYGSKVRAAVASRKPRSPTLIGRVILSFTVTRSGAVTGVSVSGGGPETAAAAAGMVRGASIPSMPAEMTQSSARYTLPINFH